MHRYTVVLTGKKDEELNLKIRCTAIGNKNKVNEIKFNFGRKSSRECMGFYIVQKAFKKSELDRLKKLGIDIHDAYAYVDIEEGELPCLINEINVFAYVPKNVESFTKYSEATLSVYSDTKLLYKQNINTYDCRAIKLVTLNIPDACSSVQVAVGVMPASIEDLNMGRNTRDENRK